MKCAIFEEHLSSCVVYSRFSGTLFPVSMIDGAYAGDPFHIQSGYIECVRVFEVAGVSLGMFLYQYVYTKCNL